MPPDESALLNKPTQHAVSAPLSKPNQLPNRHNIGASTSEKPQSDMSDAKQLVHYKGQQWKYEGYEWPAPGILSLKLKPRGSNEPAELVREAEVQYDNPDSLLRLWKTTPRPAPDPECYEMFAALRRRKLKNDKGEDEISVLVQWTGFSRSKKDTTWELKSYVEQVAPEILQERPPSREKRQRTAKISKLSDNATVPPNFRRPRGLPDRRRHRQFDP